MIERPASWPDGRPLGGENGYPPEWHAWARECEVKFIIKQMKKAPKSAKLNVYHQWVEVFSHATQDEVRRLWDEV